MKFEVELVNRELVVVEAPGLDPGRPVEVSVDGRIHRVTVLERSADAVRLEIDGRRYRFLAADGASAIGGAPDAAGRRIDLLHHNALYRVRVSSDVDRLRSRLPAVGSSGGPHVVEAVLPGVVRQVLVAPGARVDLESPLLTLEAMKMENEVRSEMAGIVEEVLVEAGQTVAARQPLVRVVPLRD